MGINTRKSNERMNAATNAANLQIARETNAANQAINQANIDYAREAWNSEVAYNWEMFDAENQYNSASAQRQRLEAAGLNPYLMMTGGNAGTASGSSSPSHNQPNQIPMQGAVMQPYYEPASSVAQDLQAVASSIGAFNQSQKTAAEVDAINISNSYARQMASAQIAQIVANTKGISEKTKGQALDNLFQGMSFGSRVQAAKMQPSFMQSQMAEMRSRVELNNINRAAQEARLPYMSEQAYADLQLTLQRVASEKSGQYLDYSKAREAVSSQLLKDKQRNNMPNITKEQADKLASLYVSQVANQKDISDSETWLKSLDVSDRMQVPKNIRWVVDVFRNK